MRGTITRWFDGRGFGFVKRDDGQPELFLHYSNVDRRPQQGDVVEFDVGTSSKGRPEAVCVRVLDYASPSTADSEE